MPTQTLATPRSATTTVDQWVLRVAGLFVLLSVALSQAHSIHWLWFTAFVGANMLQASFTGFCPLAKILERLGAPSGAAFFTAPRHD